MTFGAGGFMCSFSDKELAEFHHFLEKEFPFQESTKTKRGIMYAGKQPEGVWALNNHVYVDENGTEKLAKCVKLAWPPIGGPCIELTGKNQHCALDLQSAITLPLQSAAPVQNLLHAMRKIFKHNFLPSKK